MTPPRPGQVTPRQPPEAAGPGGDGLNRSGKLTGHRVRAAAAAPSPDRAGPVAAVPYLAVLACVAAGVYISWHQGSQGGGQGGVIAGSALIAAAAARLVLPGKLAGLLASRRRVIDMVTLAALGVCLLVLGLVLPRLGPLFVQGKWLARR